MPQAMKVIPVVGVRPQLIKEAPVGRALRAAGHTEGMRCRRFSFENWLSRSQTTTWGWFWPSRSANWPVAHAH